MRYWTVTLLAIAAFAACTYLFCEQLTTLLDVGTCASGNQPFVVARECPEGTESDGLLLGASIIGLLLSGLLLVFRGPRPEGSRATGIAGLVLAGWALFFTVSGTVSLVHSLTSDVIGPDGKTGGIIVGVTFLLMGLPVLAFVLAGLVARLRGRDERPSMAFSASPMADRAASGLFGSIRASRVEQLERLQRLREAGALSEAEFEAEKARVLSGS